MPRSTKPPKTPTTYPIERVTREFICSCGCKFGEEPEAHLHEVAVALANDIGSVVSPRDSDCDECGGEFQSCNWARVVVRGKTLENLERALRAVIRERKRYSRIHDRAEKKILPKMLRAGLDVLKSKSVMASVGKKVTRRGGARR